MRLLASERDIPGEEDRSRTEETSMPEDRKGEKIEIHDDLEIEDLTKAVEHERKMAEDLNKKILYLQADFQNYRRRAEAELEEVSLYGSQNLIYGLLKVADELELAVKAGEGSKESGPLVKGVKMALKRLVELLQNEGVSRIEAIGKQFDPSVHEAIESVPTADLPEGRVVEEIRSGFMLRGKVIRPSLVKVSCLLTSKDSKKGESKE